MEITFIEIYKDNILGSVTTWTKNAKWNPRKHAPDVPLSGKVVDDTFISFLDDCLKLFSVLRSLEVL